MLKIQEEKNDQKQSIKMLSSMSSRQQILYLMNKTQNMSNWNESDNLEEEEILDYRNYFFKKKEKIREMTPRHVHLQRAKFLKQSLKEFTLIKKNIYLDRKKYTCSEEDKCECKRKTINKSVLETLKIPLDQNKEDELFGCGTRCINKTVSTECVENFCPTGAACRNRRFQQHLYAEVYPIKTQNRGWGLCAGEFLPKGSFVIQYIGEIYSIDSQTGISKLKEYRNRKCTYLMEISKKEVIDPTYKGNLARFINHSCEPNCETQKWHVLGEVCVGMFTLRDINEGEELTFNYGFNILKTTFQKCLCGASTCKGYLGIVSQNDVPRGTSQTILCDYCKNSCKPSEKFLVCEICKKVFHKNCTKNLKDKKSFHFNNEFKGNEFVCQFCRKKKLNITNHSNMIPNISLTTKQSNINPLSLFSSNDKESKEKYKDKKSSQQLIREYKNRNKNKNLTNINLNTDESISISESTETLNKDNIEVPFNLNMNLNLESDLNTKTSIPEVIELMSNKENTEMSLIQEVQIPSSPKSKKFEEDLVIEKTIEVDECELKKIKTNLKQLSDIGARLFWDFRQQLILSSSIELKITGTKSQIEKVSEQINKIKEQGSVTLDSYSTTINVPQIFVRKIIGHQNRNLISYRSKYNVEMEYDQNLITDDIFPIYETTQITIKGKENFVKYVENDINRTVQNLKVLSIFLMPTDYNYIKANICQLKTVIDPGDVRLRKRDYKIDREIKHSFYYVPCTNKDLVVIGYENEIKKGEKIIREFLLRQNILEYNYSLCFLYPTYFLNQINAFKNENANLLKNRNLLIKVFEPVYSRKHLNIYMEGKWKDIIDIKNLLFKYMTENEKMNSQSNYRKKDTLSEFQQYTFNQEHKLISKNLRKYFIEKNYVVKNWDLISDEVWQVWDSATGTSGNYKNSINTITNSLQKEKEEDNQLIKHFVNSTDRDTTLNYLLHLPAGSYNSVFNMNQLDLTKDLIFFVEEAFESYKLKKKESEDIKKAEIPNNNDINNVITKSKSVDKEPIEEDFVENLTDDGMNVDPNNNSLSYLVGSEADNFSNIRNSTKFQETINLEKNNSSSFHQFEEVSKFENYNKIVSDTNNIVNTSHAIFNSVNNNQMINSFSNPLFNNNNNTNLNSFQLKNNNQNKVLNNNMPSSIDNIQSTLLNKLNEIKSENKNNIINNNINNNTNDYKSKFYINSNTSSNQQQSIGVVPPNSQNINNQTPQNYEIVVSQDDLNLLIKNKNTIPSNNINSEQMNILYKFSNISQMNININISSFQKESSNENANNPDSLVDLDNQEKDLNIRESKYLKKKLRPDKSLSPTPKRRGGNYNSSYEKEREIYQQEKSSKYNNNNNFSSRYFKKHSSNLSDNNKYNFPINRTRAKSRSKSRSRNIEKLELKNLVNDRKQTSKSNSKSSSHSRSIHSLSSNNSNFYNDNEKFQYSKYHDKRKDRTNYYKKNNSNFTYKKSHIKDRDRIRDRDRNRDRERDKDRERNRDRERERDRELYYSKEGNYNNRNFNDAHRNNYSINNHNNLNISNSKESSDGIYSKPNYNYRNNNYDSNPYYKYYKNINSDYSFKSNSSNNKTSIYVNSNNYKKNAFYDRKYIRYQKSRSKSRSISPIKEGKLKEFIDQNNNEQLENKTNNVNKKIE